MKKKKKKLRKRLLSLLLNYLNGLSEKKKEKSGNYPEDKLDNVLAFYLSLLNKKEREHLVAPKPAGNKPLDQPALREKNKYKKNDEFADQLQ